MNALFLAFGTLFRAVSVQLVQVCCCPPDDQDEFMEKKQSTDHDILYFHDLQYGWMSDTYRRSTTFNGIYAWCSILLELTLVPDLNFQYDFIIDHFLLN